MGNIWKTFKQNVRETTKTEIIKKSHALYFKLMYQKALYHWHYSILKFTLRTLHPHLIVYTFLSIYVIRLITYLFLSQYWQTKTCRTNSAYDLIWPARWEWLLYLKDCSKQVVWGCRGGHSAKNMWQTLMWSTQSLKYYLVSDPLQSLPTPNIYDILNYFSPLLKPLISLL